MSWDFFYKIPEHPENMQATLRLRYMQVLLFLNWKNWIFCWYIYFFELGTLWNLQAFNFSITYPVETLRVHTIYSYRVGGIVSVFFWNTKIENQIFCIFFHRYWLLKIYENRKFGYWLRLIISLKNNFPENFYQHSIEQKDNLKEEGSSCFWQNLIKSNLQN